MHDDTDLAALMETKIFRMHSEIRKSVHRVEHITNITRPIYMDYATGVIRDLLWLNPIESDSVLGIAKGFKGTNLITFGRAVGGRLIIDFSATKYCGSAKNAGAIIVTSRDLVMVPKLIHPNPPSLEKKSSVDSPVKAWMEELIKDVPASPAQGWLRSEESTVFSLTFDTTSSSSSS